MMRRVRATAGPVSVAAGTVLLIGVLRAWFPLSLVIETATTVEATLLVLAPCVAAFVVGPALVATVGARRTLLGAASGLVLARLTLQWVMPTGGDVPLAAALVALAAATVWLAAVAAGGVEQRGAVVGLVAGVGLDAILHHAVRTIDAVWRTDPSGWVVVGILCVILAVSSWLARELETPAAPTAAALPWLAAGPLIALHLVAVTSPHLTAFGGLDPLAALAVLVAAHLVAVLAVASLVTAPSRPLPALGGGLLLLALAATLARRMPFETATVHGAASATVVVAAALCATVLGLPRRGRSPAAAAATAIAGVVLAVLAVLAHEGHLDALLTGTGVWFVAVLVAALGLAALRPLERGAAASPAGRPALTLGAIVLALGAGAAVVQPTGPAPAEAPGAHLRLTHQYVGDVRGHALTARLAESLVRAQPDLVTLVDTPRGGLTAGGVDPIPTVSRTLGLDPVVARTDPLLRGDVILGAAPTREIRTEPLPGGGVVLIAVLDLPGGPAAVASAHLPAQAVAATREAQIARIASIVGDLDRLGTPTILAGTFWRAPDAEELAPLRDRSRSLSARGLPVPTWPTHAPRVAMDQVYVTDGIVAGDLTVGPTSVGAHRPVIVDLRVTTPD